MTFYILVTTVNSNQCNRGIHIDVQSSSGYLASITSQDTPCGSGNAPWTLQAQEGQTINLTLIDFSWDEHYSGGAQECQKTYGHILSYASDDIIQICGRRSRVQHIDIKPSHHIQIILDAAAVIDHHFIIRFEGVYYFIFEIIHIYIYIYIRDIYIYILEI